LTCRSTLGALLLDAPVAPRVTGTAPLTFSHGAMPSLLEVALGHPTLDVPVAVPTETTAWIEPETSLTLAGNLSGAGAFTAQGGGTLILTATNTVAAPSSRASRCSSVPTPRWKPR
jgi:hypothetical protein